MNEFATKLKALLKKKEVSQGELSRRTELSATHISNIINGKRLPTKDAMSKINAALKLGEKERADLVGAIGRVKYS